jgi:hypothetical protein
VAPGDAGGARDTVVGRQLRHVLLQDVKLEVVLWTPSVTRHSLPSHSRSATEPGHLDVVAHPAEPRGELDIAIVDLQLLVVVPAEHLDRGVAGLVYPHWTYVVVGVWMPARTMRELVGRWCLHGLRRFCVGEVRRSCQCFGLATLLSGLLIRGITRPCPILARPLRKEPASLRPDVRIRKTGIWSLIPQGLRLGAIKDEMSEWTEQGASSPTIEAFPGLNGKIAFESSLATTARSAR